MRGGWDRRRLAAVGVGGAIGAGLRWAALAAAGPSQFPWPVLLLNVIGSILLGVLLAEEARRKSDRLLLHDAGAIGFCGGLTTFSTFAVEVAQLLRGGDLVTAAAYGIASVVGAIAGVIAGAAALRRARAIALPVEESL